MPLAPGVHVCLECGLQRPIEEVAWTATADDSSVFSTDPCPCGTSETYVWHDDVYVDRKGDPDPDHFGARQEVLIQQVALALKNTTLGGLSRRHLKRPTGPMYAQLPREPTSEEVAGYLEKHGGRTMRQRARQLP